MHDPKVSFLYNSFTKCIKRNDAEECALNVYAVTKNTMRR